MKRPSSYLTAIRFTGQDWLTPMLCPAERTKPRKFSATLSELSKRKYVPAFYFGEIYAGMGDQDQAMKWLETAYEERSDRMVHIKVEPKFDSLRADRRFQDLLRRMRLAP